MSGETPDDADAVTLAGVSLGYPGRPVLSGVDVALRRGEFVGLFGANGAGKTTLMRALLGLVAPSAGRIAVLSAAARPGQAGVGYLPQAREAAIPPVRGIDLLTVSVQGRRFGLPRPGRADRGAIGWALAQVDAAALAARPLRELSGGERQRVLIAQALLGHPRVLLLDEPLANLDPRHQHDVIQLLRAVQQRLGLTVLCSAHDLNVLLPVMDRVLYLGGGRAALGSVAEVVTGPVLSRLYGAPIEVLHAGGRVFVSAEAAFT
jgi:zinc/manganese transport system ATP-binding protein